VRRGAPSALTRERAHVDRTHGRVQELGRRRARDAERHLGDCARRAAELARRGVTTAGLRLDASERAVRALDPRRVLERGYTVTRTGDGRVVRRAVDVAPGDELMTELASGHIASRVEIAEDDQ
jgi:exodeoxyribonuclease VII large subunit